MPPMTCWAAMPICRPRAEPFPTVNGPLISSSVASLCGPRQRQVLRWAVKLLLDPREPWIETKFFGKFAITSGARMCTIFLFCQMLKHKLVKTRSSIAINLIRRQQLLAKSAQDFQWVTTSCLRLSRCF